MTDPVLRMTAGAENSPTWTNYTPGVSERTSGTSKFMHAGIKNTDAQSNSLQAISATREYDAFGDVTSSTGTHTGRFGYGGPYGYQEDEGGLKQLGHRLYDPVAGRFVTKDPIKDGRNWYGYCRSKPTSLCDPHGLIQMGCLDDTLAEATRMLDPNNPPVLPNGESYERNMDKIEEDLHASDGSYAYSDTAQFGRYVGENGKWVTKEMPGGEWDYKRLNRRYENAGNFNYGATGVALGMSEEELLRAAGYVQEHHGAKDPNFGHWNDGPPYGDDPWDQEMIKRGIRWGRARLKGDVD